MNPNVYDEARMVALVRPLATCPKATADALRMGTTTLYQQLDGRLKLSVRVVARLQAEALAADPDGHVALAPLRYLAHGLGCGVFRLPSATPQAPAALTMVRATAELGDVARRLEAALADGRIDVAELHAIEGEAVEAIGALHEVIEAARREASAAAA